MKLASLLLPAILSALPCVAADKPNIVFILTDDQAVDAVAASGEWGVTPSGLRTPNMDRLYQDGTSFSRAYNMGAWAGAVCVASRSMLNSGQLLWHAHHSDQTKFHDPLEGRQMWSQRMKDAGYETYMSGKWHVETPVNRLFDHVKDVRPGMAKTVKSAYNRPVEGQPDTWEPWDKSNGGYWEGGRHWSEVLADNAGEFIEQAKESGKPFFMYLAFNAPHDPRQSPESFVSSYPLDKVPLPDNFMPANPHHVAMGLKVMRDEELAPFPRTEYAIKCHRREYQALVTHLDEQIGRVLTSLAQADLAENTYVILTSDHGLALGRHGLMGKQNLYEHSLRVPWVIRGPGIPKGARKDTRIYMQDAMATTLDLAGADSKGVEFTSVMPIIRGERESLHDSIYAAYSPKFQRAVIDGDHKLILYPSDKSELLFNLAKDPLELNDLASQPESAGIKKRLFARLLQLQKETGDPLDLKTTYTDLVP